MSEVYKKYIEQGNYLVCDKGSSVSLLIANKRNVNLNSNVIGTDKDNVFEKNIPSFGTCKTLKGPCSFDCVKWENVKNEAFSSIDAGSLEYLNSDNRGGGFYINGENPLLEHSEAKCKVGQGTIKIYPDLYEAELAKENDNESPFVKENFSSIILGEALVGPFGKILDLFSDDDKFSEGVGRGFKKGMEGTWNFFTEDIWKGETWSGLGKLMVISSVEANPITSLTGTLGYIDSTFGTDYCETRDNMVKGLEKGAIKAVEDVRRGNLGEVGETVGQTIYLVVEAFVGPKGVGLVGKGIVKGTELTLGASKYAKLTGDIGKVGSSIRKVFRVGRKFEYHATLTDDVLEEAMRIIGNTSSTSRGPCLSGIYDPATGKTFYGINFKGNATGKAAYEKWLNTPAELGGADPIIKKLVKKYEADIASGKITLKEVTDTKFAAHSELSAFDQALKARREAGIRVDKNSIKEMSLSNRAIKPKDILENNGIPPLKKRCQNCEYLTDGIQLHGHK